MVETKHQPERTTRLRKTDWSLRPGVPEDESKLKAFLAGSIWAGCDVDQLYRWKFKENPFGEVTMLLAVNSLEEIVGLYCYMPWQFCFEGRVFNATQMVDAFTAVDYRGQGIVDSQIQAGLAHFYSRDYPISFAFPNENMAPGHRRNNACLVGLVRRLIRPIHTRRLIRHVIPWPALVTPVERVAAPVARVADLALHVVSRESRRPKNLGWAVERMDHCGPESDDFWQAYSALYARRMMSRKTSDYLNWKYVHSPNPHRHLFALTRSGRLGGFIVADLPPGPTAGIVDVVALDRDAFDSLVRYVMERCIREKKDAVTFAALEDHPHFHWFRAFGFFPHPVTSHYFIYLDPNMPLREPLASSEGWSITLGDIDVTQV